MTHKLQITTIALALFFVILTGHTLSQQVVFNKVLLQETQSLGNVDCFVPNENGFMWIATKTGLYSYDGNQVASFRNDPSNPNSLSGNFLTSVIIDNNSIIWSGGLGNGLDRFDSNTGTFTNFQHNPNDPTSLINDTIIVIIKDKKGLLWIGTGSPQPYNADFIPLAIGTEFDEMLPKINVIPQDIARIGFEFELLYCKSAWRAADY